MTELKVFENEMFGKLEILIIDGKEYFPATEMGRILGYSNPHKAIKDHCKLKGVNETLVPTSGGNQKKKYIDEGNLYRLIVKSKLPTAEKFESWVFDEVLPSIRKHGAYMTDETLEKAIADPDFMIGLLTSFKEEKQKRLEAEAKIEQDKPLVTFAETALKSKDSILVRQLAKIAQDNNLNIGEKRLYRKLREWGWILTGKTEPSQRAMNMGLFVVEEKIANTAYGTKLTRTTKVTPKGQVSIIEKLKKDEESIQN